jgi:hypothetical protein
VHIWHREWGLSTALDRSPIHSRTDDQAVFLHRTGQEYWDTLAAVGGIALSRSESGRDDVAEGNADDTAAGKVAYISASETALAQTAGQIVGRLLTADQTSLGGSKDDRVPLMVGFQWNR